MTADTRAKEHVASDPTPASRPGAPPWETLFDELVELPAEERERRLAELRAGDAELAARLERLLAADAASAGFLDRSTLNLSVEGPADEVEVQEPQLPAGTTIGPWRVIHLLGRGGMGEVYLAERHDPSFTQRVALKVIKRGMDSQAIVRRFVRERQILARLDHPNLARFLDGGTAPDGRPFFALEFVDGEPINAWCDRHGVDLDGRLRLMQTVCEAVASAHSRLVVHRDLKPANILVTADGTPKLLDFGIAKLLAEEEAEGLTATHLGGRPLTPAYAAPEQILGEPVSTATDVYALGVLLYELITGTLPHRRDQRALHALASAVEHETVERPSAVLRRPGDRARLARRVAGDLDLLVMTAVHRDPARRYASAQALANDLGHFLAGRPIRARPDEVGYRMRKFVARHRLPVAAVLASVAALIVCLALALWQARAARLAATRADAEAKRAERVKSFLIAIFQQSNPESGKGPTLTARELLEHGAASVDTGLAGEPEMQADLLDAVARIENSLGLLGPGLAHAERALALRRQVLGSADGRIGLSLVTLGEVQHARGAMKEAIATFESALPLLVRAYGADSLEAASARRGLANALPEPEESRRCALLMREVHAAYVRHLGEDKVETAIVLSDLGGALEADQQYREAESAYRRALVALERRLGPTNPKVAEVQVLLGHLLGRLGRYAEARPLFEAAIATERAVLPRSHDLGDMLFNYALTLTTQQEYARADQTFAEALGIFGPDRFEAAHCLRYLGRSAIKQERYREAASLLARAAETYRRTLPGDQVQQWRAVADLGRAHLRLGRISEARAEVTEAVSRIERAAGAGTYEVLEPLRTMGEIETAAGQATAAVATLRRTKALYQKLFAGTGEHPEIASTDLLLARALLARAAPGDAREARQVLDEGLQIIARTLPQDLFRAECLLESGRLAMAEHDRVRARADLAAALPLLVLRKGPTHAETREVRELLAAAGG